MPKMVKAFVNVVKEALQQSSVVVMTCVAHVLKILARSSNLRVRIELFWMLRKPFSFELCGFGVTKAFRRTARVIR